MLTTTAVPRIDLIAPRMDAHAHPFLVDQRIDLHLSGFTPEQPVTVQAVSTPEEGVWKAQATFLTDENGEVDVATQAPLAGCYRDADAMGLFWSMRLDESAASPRDNRITFTAVQGEHIQARAEIEHMLVAPDVTRRVVRELGLYGTLFLPPGEGPHPGLLVLGGSSGGLPEFVAQMVASHGYAALALAYFRYEDLPTELQSIPLEYFETALQWMQAHESIRGDRIGVYGLSRGGELALLLAATFPQIKAVVGVVPSVVVWQGLSSTAGVGEHSSWSFHGQDLPCVAFTEEFGRAMHQAMQEHTAVTLTPHHLSSLEHADVETLDRAVIRVEKTQGPILLVSGQDDQLWPSSLLSDMVIRRLAQQHHPYPYRHITYPGAGHLITFPYRPTTINRADWGLFTLALGGDAPSQAEAVQDAWMQILEFLAHALPQ